ncbi:hypothetical protein SAMN04515668_4528 [Hymenobacter arizonensis]|uniref:Uncharacterized protein n=1 Tax=Hymenobacter arizonensis TaxID=1227077 RepID=A0A1I6BGE0_HYMAR|nr:hypothetical protein SAMN04515668_4528 [Hymenobacter arizonensis]
MELVLLRLIHGQAVLSGVTAIHTANLTQNLAFNRITVVFIKFVVRYILFQKRSKM